MAASKVGLNGFMLIGLCGALAMPVRAAAPSPVVTALFTILGASEEARAALNHCRTVDPANITVYDGLGLRIINVYMPYSQRADEILPVEGTRAGLGERFYYPILYSLRGLAETAAKDLVATLKPEQVIASCRAQRGDFQQQRGFFASPASRFSKEERTLKDWR